MKVRKASKGSSVLSLQFSILKSQSSILSLKFSVLNPKLSILGTQSLVLNNRSSILSNLWHFYRECREYLNIRMLRIKFWSSQLPRIPRNMCQPELKHTCLRAANLFKISFRVSAERVQALPINLQYIYKRVFTGRQPQYIDDIYLVVPTLDWHSLGRWFWKGFQH